MASAPPTDPGPVEADVREVLPGPPAETHLEELQRSVDFFDSANSPLFSTRVVPIQPPDERA